MLGLLPGEADLKLQQEGPELKGALGPASPARRTLGCVAVRICLAPRSFTGVCWGESSARLSKWLSKCLLPHLLGP